MLDFAFATDVGVPAWATPSRAEPTSNRSPRS